MRVGGLVLVPRGVTSPGVTQIICNPRNRLSVVVGRSKIPSRGKFGRILCQTLSEHQIATQGLQHELPRPRGERIPNRTGFFGKKGPNQVWNQLIAGPVTASDGVSGARGPQRDVMLRIKLRRKIGITKGGGDQLRATFGIGIRIMTSHGVVFAITPNGLAVGIALVAGYVNNYAWPLELPNGFEQIYGAHHI